MNPKKAFVIVRFKLPPQGEEIKGQLEDAGIGILTYDSHFEQYGVRIDPAVIEPQRLLLLQLIRQAWEGFGKP